MAEQQSKKIVIIGAGPAGLTAAYQLRKTKTDFVVLERDAVVGGLSRTVNYKGYHFDIGGHRFFTKVEPVAEMWREVLGTEDFLERPRLSRIYYDNKFFHYPLQATNALFGLGIWNSVLIFLSYLRAKLFPVKPETTLEAWVTNRFGRRLYETFFKTYTEKVWGIPCDEISADWAASRIKGLSLIAAMKNALLQTKRSERGAIKTLITEFHYPRRGPGQMWEAVADVICEEGTRPEHLRLGVGVEKIHWSASGVEAVEVNTPQGRERVAGSDFISTMPVRELIAKLQPPAPADVRRAAGSLNYRDFLTVALIINKRELFPDNWIYIHDPRVRLGRIQNFKNWSPEMVPDDSTTCLGLEYFCFEGDELWTKSDAELIALAKSELALLGLVVESDVADGSVVRMPKAYPVYDATYLEALSIVREFLTSLTNLQLVGRNGMHKYNNQDHSMLTAMLAVENIHGAQHDLWQVNADDEYHEEAATSDAGQAAEMNRLLASTQPRVPRRHHDALPVAVEPER